MAFLVSKRKSVLLSYYQEEEQALFGQVRPSDWYRGYLSVDEIARRGKAINVGFHPPICDRRTYKVIETVVAAPKEVSLLFAFGDRICREATLAAHMEATDETLRLIEAEFSYASISRGGVNTRKSGVVEPLAFTHVLSRSKDPHLHSHILIPNSVLLAEGARSLSFDLLSYGSKYADIVYLSTLKSQLGRPELAKAVADAAKFALLPTLHEQFSKRSREVNLFDAFNTSRSRAIAQRLSRETKGELGDLAQVFEGWKSIDQPTSTAATECSINRILDKAIMNAFRDLEERALVSGVDYFFLRARDRVRQTLTNVEFCESPIVSRLTVGSTNDLGSDPVSRLRVLQEETLAIKLDGLDAKGWKISTVRSNRTEELVALDGLIRSSSVSGAEVFSADEDRVVSIGDTLNSTAIEFDQLKSMNLKDRKIVMVTSATALPALLNSVALDRAAHVELVVVDQGRYKGDQAIGRGASIRNDTLAVLAGVDECLEVDDLPALTIDLVVPAAENLGCSTTMPKQQIEYHGSAKSLVKRVVDEQLKSVECGGLIFPEQLQRPRLVVGDDDLRSLISRNISDRLRSEDEAALTLQSSQFRNENSQAMKEKYLSFCEVHPLRKEVTINQCEERVGFNAFGVMSKREFDRTLGGGSIKSDLESKIPGEICSFIGLDRETEVRLEPLPLQHRSLRRATFGERAISLLDINIEVESAAFTVDIQNDQWNEDRDMIDAIDHLARHNAPTPIMRNLAEGSINRRIARIVDLDYVGNGNDGTDHGRIVANVRVLAGLVNERRRQLGLPLGMKAEKVSRFIEVGLSYLDKEELLDLNRGSSSRQNAPRELSLERELSISL